MSQYQFCSRCAAELKLKVCENDHTERLTCVSCGYILYHNPKPTVKALIFKEDKVLMVRRAEEPHIGGWDLPGGYMEWDEHHDEAVLRETMEETGVVAEIVQMLGVFHKVWNPKNEDSSILNICYLCRYVSGEAEVLSPLEIDRAEWVSLNELPGWMAYGHYDEAIAALNLLGEDVRP